MPLTAPKGHIVRPDQPELLELAEALSATSAAVDQSGAWPVEPLRRCGEAGVFRWFVPQDKGGIGWSEADILTGYLHLSAACLTTSFILTQATGALRRIAASRAKGAQEILEDLLTGSRLASLGISHLTTSHRHFDKPILRAEVSEGGFLLDGFSPWVTGSSQIDFVVIGAELDDGRQILGVLPMDHPGVSFDPPGSLMALTGSQTGAVRFDHVALPEEAVLAGPEREVLVGATGASTGGLQTSALAIGLADRAVRMIEEQCIKREESVEPAQSLRAEQIAAKKKLLTLAAGGQACSPGELRGQSNSLALRASQAALAAVKGAGFVRGHPAGQLCREALFFLVWSCPQPVMAANLCELAGLAE